MGRNVNSRDIQEIYTNYMIKNENYNEINHANEVEKVKDKWSIFSFYNNNSNKIERNSSIHGRYLHDKNCAA
jgi:hypothetical protein